MAIAHDTSTRWPATENTQDIATGDQAFTHTPSGTPKGVAVVICTAADAAAVTGALYGGAAMTLTRSVSDVTEPGRVEVYTLTETDVPTGAQTVTLQGCSANAKFVTCSTVTAATSQTKVHTHDVATSASGADPQVTLTTSVTTQVYGGLHTGAAAPATTPAAGCTLQNNRDYGAKAANTLRRTSADAAGSPTLGVTLGADDYGIVAVALEEFEPPAAAADYFRRRSPNYRR